MFPGMTLIFERFTGSLDADSLPAHMAEQLVAAGRVADGESHPVEVRLDPSHSSSIVRDLECWCAKDKGDQVHFEVWVFHVDCGAVFVAGSAELVGPIVQFGFSCKNDKAWEALAKAYEASAIPKGSLLASIDFSQEDDGWQEPGSS